MSKNKEKDKKIVSESVTDYIISGFSDIHSSIEKCNQKLDRLVSEARLNSGTDAFSLFLILDTVMAVKGELGCIDWEATDTKNLLSNIKKKSKESE